MSEPEPTEPATRKTLLPPIHVDQLLRFTMMYSHYVKNEDGSVFRPQSRDETEYNRHASMRRREYAEMDEASEAKSKQGKPQEGDPEEKKPPVYLNTVRNTTGLFAIIEGAHLNLRNRGTQMHDKNYPAVKEAMGKITLPVPVSDLKPYLNTLRVMKEGIPEEHQYVRNMITAHIARVEALMEQPKYTLADKAELLIESLGVYRNARDHFPDLSTMNTEFQTLFINFCDEVREIPGIDLKLKDAQGNTIPLTLKNTAQSRNMIVGGMETYHYPASIIFAGIAGKVGIADRHYVPFLWNEIVSDMLGVTDMAAQGMHYCSQQVEKALEEQGYDETKIREILSCSDFNITPRMWENYCTMLQQEIPAAAFQMHVIELAGMAQQDGTIKRIQVPMKVLRHMEPIVRLANESLAEAGRNIRIEIPDVDTLAPRTRFDHYGLLGAMMHNDIGMPDAMMYQLMDLRDELCPDSEPSNVAPGCYAQHAPDPMQRMHLESFYDEVREFVNAQADQTRDPNYMLGRLRLLLDVAARQPAQSEWISRV